MEYGSIEREIHVEATPEVVYQVISTPEHLRGWWPDEAELEPRPGAIGVITFGDQDLPGREGRPPHGGGGRPAPAVLLPLGVRRGSGRDVGQLAPGDLRPGPVGGRHAAALLRGGLPGEGLGGGRARGGVPRPRRRLGPLPASPRHVRRAAGVDDGERRHRRRALVRGRRTDPAPDARRAAERRRGHGDHAERAAARHAAGGRQAPRVSSNGSDSSTSRPPDASVSTRWTRPSLPARSRSCRAVGATWDARLHRIKRIAEAIQRSQEG